MSLYSNPSARIFTSGNISKSLNLTNETRQGCPLSPIIFSLGIEPLAESIRSKNTIKGIKIGQTEHKIGLFVDDIILAISDPESTISEIQNTLGNFGKISYYKVNDKKCFLLPMNMKKWSLLS